VNTSRNVLDPENLLAAAVVHPAVHCYFA